MRISFHTSDIGRQQAYIIKLRTYYSQKFLGHINLDNILLYIQIEQAIFGINSGDKYLVNATNNKQEIKKMLSVGYEYICQKMTRSTSENANKIEHVRNLTEPRNIRAGLP